LFGLELDAYRATITNWENKLLIWLHSFVSDHGQSLWKPVFWIFILNTMFLLLYGYLGSWSLPSSTSLLLEHPFHILDITPLDILHNSPISQLLQQEKYAWLASIDQLRRVFIAALAFQFLVASSKFKFSRK
jgi:hypothetical protein